LNVSCSAYTWPHPRFMLQVTCFRFLMFVSSTLQTARSSPTSGGGTPSPTLRRASGINSFIFSSPDYIDASRWCIDRADLDFLETAVRGLWSEGKIPNDPQHPNPDHDNPQIGPSILQVVTHYLIPGERANSGVSWALQRHPYGLKCDVFVTHCWAEGVFEFITQVRQAWPADAHHLWCCFLANPQDGFVSELLAGNIDHSPFARALSAAKCFLVIPNRRVSIYTRLWCVFEAHTAIRCGLEIKLPLLISRLKQVLTILLGTLLLACSCAASYFALSQRVGFLFGPLMWVIIGYVGTSCVGFFRNRQRVLSNPWTLLTLLRIATMGLAFGISVAKITGRSTGNWFAGNSLQAKEKKEFGVSMATIQLGSIMMCSFIYEMGISLTKAAIARSAFMLDFATVRDATCTDRSDEVRIRDKILGFEDDIDSAIRKLIVIGKYDRQVQRDLTSGISLERIRNGINPFRVMTACMAWMFWWETDLWGNKLFLLSVEVPITICMLSTVLVYRIGLSADFAVQTFILGGLLQDAVCLLYSRFVFPTLLTTARLVWHTRWIQAVFFSLVLIANIFHYKGFHVCDDRPEGYQGLDVFEDTALMHERPAFPSDADILLQVFS